MPAKYKLTYFDARGRGEPIRMLFAAADVKYDEVRVKFEDWPELKPKMPQNTLPILEVSGTVLSQSFTIARFVAKELKLYGKNNLEAAFIDEIIDTLLDLQKEGLPAFFEKDEAKKAEMMKKFMEEAVPKYLQFLENDIGKFGKDGFAVSRWISIADVAIYTLIEFFKLKDNLGSYPKIAASNKKVEENRNIAKYLRERPAAAF